MLSSARLFVPLLLLSAQGQLQPGLIDNFTVRDFKQLVSERTARLARDEMRRAAIIEACEFSFAAAPCVLQTVTQPTEIDPRRSLFVHDNATLNAGDFSLRHTLTQIASQAATVVPGTTAVTTFRQFLDTQNPSATGVTSGPHCDDAGGRLNGFPTHCSNALGDQAKGTDAEVDARIDQYHVLGLVNRLDLAHQGWRNCGEYRIIYGLFKGDPCACSSDCSVKGKGCQAYIGIIFEAVLPNPKPGCRDGCRPVANFWKSLSSISEPSIRAQKLEQFFYTGLSGFRPVVHVDHYGLAGVARQLGGSGSGQIRTTYYAQREFKTVIDCGATPCRFLVVPIPVKTSPYSVLWNEDVAHRRGIYRLKAQQFQADVVAQLQSLSASTLMDITYTVDPEHDAADGSIVSLPPDNTVDDGREFKEAAGLATSFRTALGSGLLTNMQVVRRASALSCEGCHSPGSWINKDTIGTVTTPANQVTTKWPSMVGLTGHHIDVSVSTLRELSVGGFFGDAKGHRLSPALLDVFLPDRKNFLLQQLNAPHCQCQHRFHFLPDEATRIKARAIEESVRKAFGSRSPTEQDNALRAELQHAGIMLPADANDLRPQMLRFDAVKLAQGDLRREHALRAAAVVKMLRSEPPRRTVTGSFRVH